MNHHEIRGYIQDARQGWLAASDLWCANRDARACVLRKEPFLGNNTGAHWVTPTIYVVWSYGPHWPAFMSDAEEETWWEPLFMFDAEEETWWENDGRYSPTTSKHRGQLHPLTDTRAVPLDTLARTIDLLVNAASANHAINQEETAA